MFGKALKPSFEPDSNFQQCFLYAPLPTAFASKRGDNCMGHAAGRRFTEQADVSRSVIFTQYRNALLHNPATNSLSTG